MADLVYLVLTVAFFALTVLLVGLLDRTLNR